MQFSKDEIRDILIAVVSLVFILALKPLPNLGLDFNVLPGYFIGVVLGFLLHEMAHKGVATKFGAAAFFKLWPQGVAVSLLLALVSPFKIIAPGAVVIYMHKFGRWSHRLDRVFTTPRGASLSAGETGLIAVAGPIVNITLAYIFQAIPGDIFQNISYINAILAIYNLLPIPPLDGSKVFLWNGVIWLGVTIFAAVPLISFILP